MRERGASSDIDAYLDEVPADKRAALEKVRTAVRAAAPGAEEYISYQMPTFRYRGKPLVAFAAFSKHCSFFPMSMAVIDAHSEELARYGASGKGTIRFPADKPLSAGLVRKIVKARMKEIGAREAERAASRRRATAPRAPRAARPPRERRRGPPK